MKIFSEDYFVCIGCGEFIHSDHKKWVTTDCCDMCASEHYDNIEILANKNAEFDLIELSEFNFTQFSQFLTLQGINNAFKANNWIEFIKQFAPQKPTFTELDCLNSLMNMYLQTSIEFPAYTL